MDFVQRLYRNCLSGHRQYHMAIAGIFYQTWLCTCHRMAVYCCGIAHPPLTGTFQYCCNTGLDYCRSQYYGHFQLSLELDLLGERRIVQVVYKDGFPDFSPFMDHPSGVRSVEIKMVGNNIDFRRANIAAGHPEWGSGPPDSDWTWHHREDIKTMMLVPRIINEVFSHRGGASIARRR
ncbi:MAG: HNH endonuclease [Cohaesibacteraceae bacterium]|nr:HNH endonuclease [Cohaesibacteraceae bacterium]